MHSSPCIAVAGGIESKQRSTIQPNNAYKEEEVNCVEEEIWALVLHIRPGPHGLYAIATSRQVPRNSGSITISLEPPVWVEPEWPKEGTGLVIIPAGSLQRTISGWRAARARLPRPNEQPPAWVEEEIKRKRDERRRE